MKKIYNPAREYIDFDKLGTKDHSLLDPSRDTCLNHTATPQGAEYLKKFKKYFRNRLRAMVLWNKDNS